MVLDAARREIGAENHLQHDVDNFLNFREQCTGVRPDIDNFPFEEFLGHLDVEHFLRLRGKDTWSADGNEGQLIVKKLIGRIIHRMTPAVSEIPNEYLSFARQLREGDIVISLNYDILLERSMEALGRPYRLFPSRYSSISGDRGVIDRSRNEIAILKLHGSIDWFDRKNFDDSWEERIRIHGKDVIPPQHSLFGPRSIFPTTPLVDGPRFEDDPLSTLHRVADPDSFYGTDYPLDTPFILSPSNNKLLWSDPLLDFWWGMTSAGQLNLGLTIIGYSLPPYDSYMQYVLFSIARNYLGADRDFSFLGNKKGKIKIVDKLSSSKEAEGFKGRYRFLDWSDTETFFDGFGEEAVDFLFSHSRLSP